MTTLDEQYADLLSADDDPRFARLVASLDTLSGGGPSSRGDMVIRHALAVHARERARMGRSGPLPVERARQHRRAGLLRSRLSVTLAALAVALLSLGTYLHGQGPTPVSAQTVLHRAAGAGPGPNVATHATYQLSSSDSSAGSADVWIGYDGSGTPSQLALSLNMSQGGQSGPRLSARLTVSGSGLTEAYHPTRQVPAPPLLSSQPPSAEAMASQAARTMKGIVVGTLLAEKLSKQPGAYTLRQTMLDGVAVYALQPTDDGTVTYYFNAQSYVLQGADWVQDGKNWRARLESSSTVPLSAVPPRTFGPRPEKAGLWNTQSGSLTQSVPVR